MGKVEKMYKIHVFFHFAGCELDRGEVGGCVQPDHLDLPGVRSLSGHHQGEGDQKNLSSDIFMKTDLQEWKFWLSGVATLVTGVFGIIGNAVSLLVLCKR